MKTKGESKVLQFVRSVAMGVLISMLLFYGAHVFGSWTVENYRPDPETTSTILLHNKCAIIGSTHTLRPNTDISGLGEGIDGTKLTGSFMNFFDGHVPGILGLSILLGGLIFLIRDRVSKRERK